MFSPSSAIKETQASSLRVSRRRQREDSDSLRHQPLRKRSKLSENTFVPPRHASSPPDSSTTSTATTAFTSTYTSTTTSASASASAGLHVNGNSLVTRNGSADWTLGSRSASRLKDIPVRDKKQQQQQQQEQPYQDQYPQQQQQQQHHHHHHHHHQNPHGFASKRVLKADGSTILVSMVGLKLLEDILGLC